MSSSGRAATSGPDRLLATERQHSAKCARVSDRHVANDGDGKRGQEAMKEKDGAGKKKPVIADGLFFVLWLPDLGSNQGPTD